MPFYYGSRASGPNTSSSASTRRRAPQCDLVLRDDCLFLRHLAPCLAKLMETLLGWDYHACIAFSPSLCCLYLPRRPHLGHYNEVLQFFMIVLGFRHWSSSPERHRSVRPPAKSSFPVATSQNFAAGTWSDRGATWAALENPMGVGWFGMTMGLGFVLSFVTGARTSRRATRDGRQLHVCRAAHSAHRRDSEDALPGVGHPARHDRHPMYMP